MSTSTVIGIESKPTVAADVILASIQTFYTFFLFCQDKLVLGDQLHKFKGLYFFV